MLVQLLHDVSQPQRRDEKAMLLDVATDIAENQVPDQAVESGTGVLKVFILRQAGISASREE